MKTKTKIRLAMTFFILTWVFCFLDIVSGAYRIIGACYDGNSKFPEMMKVFAIIQDSCTVGVLVCAVIAVILKAAFSIGSININIDADIFESDEGESKDEDR